MAGLLDGGLTSCPGAGGSRWRLEGTIIFELGRHPHQPTTTAQHFLAPQLRASHAHNSTDTADPPSVSARLQVLMLACWCWCWTVCSYASCWLPA